jgi:hypothetical protein
MSALPSKRSDTPVSSERLFRSFFLAGFECSTHKRESGERLDLVASTRHDLFCRQDYERLAGQGILTAREGLRWHLIEKRPGRLDFATALPMIHAASETGIQVLWDLCHYGWPDHLDVFEPEFVSSFADFAAAFARLLQSETDGPFYFTPVNEISFSSYAAGEKALFSPYCKGRGLELKEQFVLAAIAATEAIRAVLPTARFLTVDPIINVLPDPRRPSLRGQAEAYRTAQYQATDMLCGRVWPLLGGKEEYLDIVGVNYYPHNQWIYPGRMIPRTHPQYRPFREMLAEIYQRYRRPLFIAETGTEARSRVSWFQYVCDEVLAAMDNGVRIEGICLYPILNHPGWVDDRHCPNGLWDYADERGNRKIYAPLAAELQRYRAVFEAKLGAKTGGNLVDDFPVLKKSPAREALQGK